MTKEERKNFGKNKLREKNDGGMQLQIKKGTKWFETVSAAADIDFGSEASTFKPQKKEKKETWFSIPNAKANYFLSPCNSATTRLHADKCKQVNIVATTGIQVH